MDFNGIFYTRDTFFSQLFGEEDPDEDVSPDTEDPEAAGINLNFHKSMNG